ncbi:MAG: glycerophosphodiester phosphodiesterase [Gemmatimonadales bacterium]
MSPTSHSPGSFPKSTVIVGSAKPPPPIFVVRRHHVFGAIGFLLALITLYLFAYEPAYHGTLVIPVPRPLILANGDAARQPHDNIVQALNGALDGGADGMNVVGQLTSEGGLAVFLGDAYAGSFEDLVRSVNGRGLVLVELVAPGVARTGIEERAVEMIRKYDANLSVVLSSSNPLVLYRVKQIDPLVRTAWVVMDRQQDDAGYSPWILRLELIRRAARKLVPVDMLSINHRVNGAVIDRLISKGWPVLIWSPDTEADIRRAVARRPYGVISNQPLPARQLRGE